MARKMTKVEESIKESSEKIEKVKKIVKKRSSEIEDPELIPEELDIEGVKKMTEKGNKVAMLGEMGCNLFYSSVSL